MSPCGARALRAPSSNQVTNPTDVFHDVSVMWKLHDFQRGLAQTHQMQTYQELLGTDSVRGHDGLDDRIREHLGERRLCTPAIHRTLHR
jgi:hypothetical protein